MQRYPSSWRHIWEVLPASATLRDITPDFVSEFKRHRYAQADALGARPNARAVDDARHPRKSVAASSSSSAAREPGRWRAACRRR